MKQYCCYTCHKKILVTSIQSIFDNINVVFGIVKEFLSKLHTVMYSANAIPAS